MIKPLTMPNRKQRRLKPEIRKDHDYRPHRHSKDSGGNPANKFTQMHLLNEVNGPEALHSRPSTCAACPGPRFHPQFHINQRKWCIPVAPALERKRQEDQQFNVILSYTAN